MKVELRLSDHLEAEIIKNLWPLYQQDISEFETSLLPNRHGLLGVDDAVQTLAQSTEKIAQWWQDSEALFPYLILVDGSPAGFNLIAARPHFSEKIVADFVVHEFFLLHPYRGKAVAERAAVEGFRLYAGRWQVVTWPDHRRAVSFWRRVIHRYTSNHFSEQELDHPWGRRVVFAFDHTSECVSDE